MVEEAKGNSVASLKSIFEQNAKQMDTNVFKPKPLVSSLNKPTTSTAVTNTTPATTKQADPPKKLETTSWIKKDSPDSSPKNAFSSQVKLAPPPKKLDNPFLNQ